MDVDSTTGLILADRKIGETALRKLFHTENCTVVKLSDLRLDKVIKQAVCMVIFGRGRSRPAINARESGILYFITDLKGNTGSLELFHDAKQKFRGVPSTAELQGTVIFLLNPKVMSDPQRPETLLFKMNRQQDIVVLGKCSTFSLCDGIRKDGKNCTMPVDTSHSTRCKFHKERSESQLTGFRPPPTAIPSKLMSQPLSDSALASTTATASATASGTASGSTAPIDFLQLALKPDTACKLGSTTSQRPSNHKSTAICPHDEGDDEEESKVSLDTRANIAADEIGQSKKRSQGERSRDYTDRSAVVSVEERKDGSVAVPKESGVFKVLSEKYYNNRAKDDMARLTADALQQTASASRAPVSAAAAAGVAASNGLLSNRHTGATRHNSLLAQNQKRKLDQTVMNKIHQFSKLRSVGGDLFDIDQARKNANKPTLKKQVELKSAQDIKQKQLDVDIEALLKRESSHVLEAEDDAFKSQMNRLDTLSKRVRLMLSCIAVYSLHVM